MNIDFNRVLPLNQAKIRAFDLIAFRGGDKLSDMTANFQDLFTGGNVFTHVGVVVTSEILPEYTYQGCNFVLKTDRIYVLESTISYNAGGPSDGNPDVIMKESKIGVQLRDLNEVLPGYLKNDKCKVAWCPLINNPLDNEPIQEIRKDFAKVFDDYYWRRYDLDLIELVAALIPQARWLRTIREIICKQLSKVIDCEGPAGWQFCSELVGGIYQDMNIISKDINVKNILPVDFFGYDQEGLPILIKEVIFLQP